MSASLQYRVPPVQPKSLNGGGHPFKGIVLEALGVRETDVGQDWSLTIAKNSGPHLWLRGYYEGMPRGNDEATDRDLLGHFLAALDQYGELELALQW